MDIATMKRAEQIDETDDFTRSRMKRKFHVRFCIRGEVGDPLPTMTALR